MTKQLALERCCRRQRGTLSERSWLRAKHTCAEAATLSPRWQYHSTMLSVSAFRPRPAVSVNYCRRSRSQSSNVICSVRRYIGPVCLVHVPIQSHRHQCHPLCMHVCSSVLKLSILSSFFLFRLFILHFVHEKVPRIKQSSKCVVFSRLWQHKYWRDLLLRYMLRACVRLSVRHKLMFYRTATHIILQTTPHYSLGTLVFWCQIYWWNSSGEILVTPCGRLSSLSVSFWPHVNIIFIKMHKGRLTTYNASKANKINVM